MDRSLNQLSVPLGQLREEVLVSHPTLSKKFSISMIRLSARDPGVPSLSVCCFEWSVVTVHVSERVGDKGFSVFSMCYYSLHMTGVKTTELVLMT